MQKLGKKNNKKFDEENQKLKAEISEYKQINKNLSEELKNSDITNRNMKTEINNLNELIEKKDIKIEKLERLKEVINEENEQLTNEYSNKIIIAEQEINRLNTEVACLNLFIS